MLDSGGTDPTSVCVSNHAFLCRPCTLDGDCADVASEAKCLDLGAEGRFCGSSCGDNNPCPPGFRCDTERKPGAQCVPDSGICPCSATSASLALTTPCTAANEYGVCPGFRTCAAAYEPLSSCDAATPAFETCDGDDDDCDGSTDEGPLCDDLNPCTEDLCKGVEGCEAIPTVGAPCDDGDTGTQNDACDAAGDCQGATIVCELGPCGASAVPGPDGCVITLVDAGAPCDDGNLTTRDDQCTSEGACIGTGYSCSLGPCEASSTPDGEACVVVLLEAGVACDDGNSGTKGDQCSSEGVCIGEAYACAPTQCEVSSSPDGVGCTVVPLPEGTPCDDAALTTREDACDGVGACFGTPYTCTPAECDSASVADGDTCVRTPREAGASCSDGVLSTHDDVCDGNGGCAGTPYACAATQCQATSEPNGDGCAVTYVSSGAVCDDGNDGTREDACDGAGSCKGTKYTCVPGLCEAASIPDGSGCVPVFDPEGSSCDDADPTTRDDRCGAAGLCSGVPYGCTPKACELSSVPDGTGCAVVYAAAGTTCDDLNPASRDDLCDSIGGCAGTPFTCPLGPCDASSTPNGSECVVTPKADGTPCGDGNACNGTELCQAGQCTNGAPVVCPPPTGLCEAVKCNPVGGQCDTKVLPGCCGNGKIESPEDCDDSNRTTEECAYGPTACEVCRADCTKGPGVPHFCGDGLTDASESCDLGSGNCAPGECVAAGKVAFAYTGAAVSWTAPSGVNSALIKVWAAGGGGGNAEGRQFPGGGGGFTSGTVALTPGESLTILVGQGGGTSAEGKTSAFPSGGQPGIRSGYTMGGGGGRSAVLRGSTELLVAGGGGGAGGTGWSSGSSTHGGGGGGSQGGNGGWATPGGDASACAGKGASQSAGGAGGQCNVGGWSGPPGGSGTKNQGGHAGDFISTGNCGGGGGDGYYGGGAAALHAGGGGGSGWAEPGVVVVPTLVAGGGDGSAANTSDPEYMSGVATSAANARGGNGLVVITYSGFSPCANGQTSCLRCSTTCTVLTEP